jgi:hypothetical protein
MSQGRVSGRMGGYGIQILGWLDVKSVFLFYPFTHFNKRE